MRSPSRPRPPAGSHEPPRRGSGDATGGGVGSADGVHRTTSVIYLRGPSIDAVTTAKKAKAKEQYAYEARQEQGHVLLLSQFLQGVRDDRRTLAPDLHHRANSAQAAGAGADPLGEPRRMALSLSRREWWLYWPIAHPATPDANVTVTRSLPPDNSGFAAALGSGRVFVVEFANTPELGTAIEWMRSNGLRFTPAVVPDASGRDLLASCRSRAPTRRRAPPPPPRAP